MKRVKQHLISLLQTTSTFGIGTNNFKSILPVILKEHYVHPWLYVQELSSVSAHQSDTGARTFLKVDSLTEEHPN